MNEEEIIRKNLKELANNIFSKLDDVEKSYLLMVNNEKNKQINELQQELQRKDNEINDLKSSIADYQEAVGDYQDEIVRKDNIINKIKKALKDHKEIKNKTNTKEYYIEVDEVLDYIKELESK